MIAEEEYGIGLDGVAEGFPLRSLRLLSMRHIKESIPTHNHHLISRPEQLEDECECAPPEPPSLVWHLTFLNLLALISIEPTWFTPFTDFRRVQECRVVEVFVRESRDLWVHPVLFAQEQYPDSSVHQSLKQ